MNGSAVYMKTLQGQEEIRARSKPLSTRERALLIMIDGRRTVNELQALSLASDETETHLRTLLDAGLIVEVAKPAETPPPPKPKALVLTAQDLEKIKRYMSTVLYDALGPDADTFAAKIENLKTAADTLKMAVSVRDIIDNVGKQKLSKQFWDNLREMIPSE